MKYERDLDILIECHDDAIDKRNAIAVDIAETYIRERSIPAEKIALYRVACLGVESTRVDVENYMAIAATKEAHETAH